MKTVIAAVFFFISIHADAGQSVLNDSTVLITKQIAANNRFESEYVGFAASPSPQFILMNTLIRVADDKALFWLTSHKSAAVRIYAFIALNGRNSRLADKAYTKLSRDQETILALNGCVGGKNTVAGIVKLYYMAE